MLIVFAGRPGTGKTTLSQRLARQLKAAVLRIDAIETVIVRCGLATPPVGPVGYVVAQEVAAGCLAAGTSVVVDGVNPVPAAREGWRCLAAAAGVSLRVVEVQLDDVEERRRDAQLDDLLQEADTALRVGIGAHRPHPFTAPSRTPILPVICGQGRL